MATLDPARFSPARPVAHALDLLGDQVQFQLRAFGMIPYAIRHYPGEILRLLALVSFGRGALALIGGTVVTVGFLTTFVGIELGIQGYNQLSTIGVESLTGFVSAYVNTRLAAPSIAGIALVATVGAGFTAQLGAMRISEEIDALDVMAVQSVAYLVSTRIVAGIIAIVPLYSIGLLASYAGTRLIITGVYGQSGGSYDYYFMTFLIHRDIWASIAIVAIGAVLILGIHCYYGYTATGGPAGVGRAVGRAVRLSLITILSADLLLSLALYGGSNSLHISG